MIKYSILVLIFLGLSAVLVNSYIDQARKSTPFIEVAVDSSLGKLYELNDQVNEGVAELQPNGESSYDEVYDSFLRLSEEFDGLRFETLGEANDTNAELANALESLHNEISAHTDLLDEYGGLDSAQAKQEIIDTFTAGSRAPLLDAIDNGYQQYNQSLGDKLNKTQLYVIAALAGFLLALACLLLSAVRGNAKLVKNQETLKSNLDLKDQELGLAETLLIEQKKLADKNELNDFIDNAKEEIIALKERVHALTSKTNQYDKLNATLFELNTELGRKNRDKASIVKLIPKIIKEYQQSGFENGSKETEKVLADLKARIHKFENSLNLLVQSNNDRPVLEDV